jgi:ornithine decarboxylase
MEYESTFILNKKILHEHYKTLTDLIPNVSYSLKTNPLVGDILAQETDCTFSVHSSGLMNHIEDKSRILFFAQAWTEQELDCYIKQGITRFVVDNASDLVVLENYLQTHSDTRITLFLRMRLKEHTVQTGKHFVYGLFSSEINEQVPRLAKHSQIEAIGLHFHRKTQNIGEWSLTEELKNSLNAQTINLLAYLNIGGGLPISYKNSQVLNREAIFEEILNVSSWAKENAIAPIIEPGRFLAGPCITLKTTIKNIYDSTIILDCSVFNAAMDTFIAHIRLNVAEEVSQREGEAYTLKGATPDSMDILRYRVYLKNPKVGDTLTFLNAGAYNFLCDFCSLPKIPTEVIDTDE